MNDQIRNIIAGLSYASKKGFLALGFLGAKNVINAPGGVQMFHIFETRRLFSRCQKVVPNSIFGQYFNVLVFHEHVLTAMQLKGNVSRCSSRIVQ